MIVKTTSIIAALLAVVSHAFTVPHTRVASQRSSAFAGSTFKLVSRPQQRKSSTSCSMFLGSDGGILGVGTPELFTILLVGYFVLGPSDLYKLTKEIGKFIQNFRTLGSEATKSFESSMETQLDLEEVRKAQRELNDAFSFRRSINVEEEGEAFAEPEKGAEPIRNMADGKKKKIRRKKRKAPVPVEEPVTEEPVAVAPADMPNGGEIPDLDAPEEPKPVEMDPLRAERMDRLSGQPDWMDGQADEAAPLDLADPAEQERFAAQLAGDWNERILENEDALSPLAQIMERIAILEEEKNAKDASLEEEFRLRNQLEEKYYRSKRDMLEEAAAEVQANAYINPETSSKKDS